MKIGFTKRQITPPVGTELGGYAGYRPCTGVHDPLYAKAVVLEQEGVRYGLVVLDLLCADEALRERVAEAVADLPIPKDHLLVCAIHTHAAPVGIIAGAGPLARINDLILPRDPAFGAYMDTVVREAAAACRAAVGNLEPFLLRSARGPVPPVGSERHTGKAAEGTLTVIQCRTESGKNLIVYNLPCHPTVMSPANTLASADFAAVIEAELGADLAVFLNGAAGDISTRFTRRESSFGECARMGRMAAQQILKLIGGAAFVQPDPLVGISDTVIICARQTEPMETARKRLEEVTARWQEAKNQGVGGTTLRMLKSYVEGAGVNLEFAQTMGGIQQLHLPVTAFRFGGQRFITVPAELYSTLLPENTAAICYANGYYRYIADRKAYDDGHYEALAAIAAPGEGEKLMEAIRTLQEKLDS